MTMNIYTEHDIEEMYNDYLDEVYPECKIAGLEYETSQVLLDIDPVAYREGFNNWLDSQLNDEILFDLDDGTYSDEEPCTHDDQENRVCNDCGKSFHGE